MKLVRFRHRGLKRLYAQDDARGVPAELADKLRKMLFALETAGHLDQMGRFPGWKLHPLKSGLAGFWSLKVTGNWRLVFRYDEPADSAEDLDLVDDHGRSRLRCQ